METFLMKIDICDQPRITARVSYSWKRFSCSVSCTEHSGAIYTTDPADKYRYLQRKDVLWEEIPPEIKEAGRKALINGFYGYYNVFTPYAVKMLEIKPDLNYLRKAIISRLRIVDDGYLSEIALKIGRVPFSEEK